MTGLFSIPEGMAYAAIGGFAAPLGLWSGVVPTIVGSVFARTALMITTLTSAIALSSQSVLDGAGLDAGDTGALATLTVLVGLVMLIMGLLRLGSVMSFVSTAVMTGFTTGIALQIITGVIEDATGYRPTHHNTLAKVVDALAHVGDWDGTTLLVTLATVGVWAAFRAVRALRSYAILIALLAVSVSCAIVQPDVELVDDIASVPRSLPPFSVPDLDAFPDLVFGAIAIALVALAQAAGIGAAVANPDGSRPDASTDFRAQGLANIAGGFFSALPYRRLPVTHRRGHQRRCADPLVRHLRRRVAGGHRARDRTGSPVRSRWRSSAACCSSSAASSSRAGSPTSCWCCAPPRCPRPPWWSRSSRPPQLPLQQAIFIGAGLSILLYAVAAAGRGQLVELVPTGDDGWRITEPPTTIPSDRTTVLHYVGGGFFAEVNRLEEEWPDPGTASHAAIVLSMRGSSGVPSATFLKALEHACLRLREHDVHLVLCGVTPEFRDLLERTGALDVFGRDAVVVQTDHLMDSLSTAYEIAEQRRTAAPNTP